MQFLQITGTLIIINALALGAYLLSQGKPIGVGGGFLIAIAVFFGAFMILSDRVTELTVKNVGTIKAAAEQITTDATEVAEIKKRVEAQAATIDLVAQDSAKAKELIKETDKTLQESQEKITAIDKTVNEAEEKIASLSEKTKDIYQLPDGRTRMGTTVSGEATILDNHWRNIGAAMESGDYPAAYEAAKKAIHVFEESEKLLPDTGTVNGYGELGKRNLYFIAAQAAQRQNMHDDELKWATKANEFISDPETKALLVVSYINNQKHSRHRS